MKTPDPRPAHAEALALLQRFELTYSPAHKPSGVPLDQHASRQVLQQRLTQEVEAIDSDGAISLFERDSQRMVTACRRVQFQGAAS